MNAKEKTRIWQDKVAELRRQHPNLGYQSAVARVTAQHPELFADDEPGRSYHELPGSRPVFNPAAMLKQQLNGNELRAESRSLEMPELVFATRDHGDYVMLRAEDCDRLLKFGYV